MDKENVNLMHGFLFAILVIVMVAAGEQSKANDKNWPPSWLMRSSAAVSGLGIATLGLSFVAAMRSNSFAATKKSFDKIASDLYRYQGKDLPNIEPHTVKKIERAGRDFGRCAGMQDHYHKLNMSLTLLSLAAVVVSPLLFVLGVCLQ